jgi:hypothetical protein
MPRWLSISLGVVCWYCAFKQLRMSRIYRGKIYSPAICPIEPNAALTAIAVGSSVMFAGYGVLVLLIPWPRLLTYLSLVWVCRAVADAILCRLGAGIGGPTGAMLTEKGRRQRLLGDIVAVASRAALLAVFAYFFGF